MKKSYSKGTLSVIIPVYNCERFIEKSIRSALQQTEVTEVVIVDDGSTDASLALAQQIGYEDPRIKIYQHIDKKNKGRSASRNLALQKVRGEYIAFLDADDYYLENRFANDLKLFAQHATYDGIYNAVGFYFYREVRSIDHLYADKLDILSCKIKSENLFGVLWEGKHGHFHLDGFTVKKKVFETVGLFNESLMVSEDTDLLWKIAIKFRLEPGLHDKALAIRGIHDANVFDRVDLYEIYTMKMYESLLSWSAISHTSFAIKDVILKRIWIIKQKENNKLVTDLQYWYALFFFNPKLLFSILSIKYFPIIRYRQTLFPLLFK